MTTKQAKILQKTFIGKCILINSSFHSYSLFYCYVKTLRLIQAV